MRTSFVLPLALLLLTLGSCSDSSKTEQLQTTNADLVARNISANADLDTFRAYLSHIESRLTSIRSEQEQLVEYLDFASDRPTGKPIDDHLNHLEYLLEDSRFQVSGMREEVRKTARKLDKQRKASGQKDRTLEHRAATIDSLSQALTERVIALELLELHQREMAAQLQRNDASMHEVFFAYGSWDELEAAGVVHKTGGFLGLGKRKMLRPDFDANYFQSIDRREVVRIPLLAEDAKLLSTHDPSSYELVRENAQLTLVVTHPEVFWRATRYLAIAVDS